jgi:hypothetical protein
MTPEAYQAHLDKEAGRLREFLARGQAAENAVRRLAGEGRESDLHKFILAECGRRNLVAFHGSTAHATHRTLGEPDFVILLPAGRVLLVECKTKTGRLSEDQIEVMTRAALLQHRIHVVRSFSEFHSVLRTALGAGEVPITQSHEVPPQT